MPRRAAASTKATTEKEEGVVDKPKRAARGRKKASEEEIVEKEAEPPKKAPRATTAKAGKDKADEKQKPPARSRAKKAPENNNTEAEPKEPKRKRAAAKKAEEAIEEDGEEQPKNKRTKKEDAKKPANKTDTDYADVVFECKKKNTKGEVYNLKISSWNVDGLRSWLKKGGLEFLDKEQPDILCLQETKCSDSKIPDEIKKVKGYHTYWCGSKKEGYAGVAVLSKIEPLDVKYGIGEEDHDDEGRCITAELDTFYLVNVYVPNAGRKLVTLPKRLEWNAAFKAYIKELDKKKPVILCGDMNVAHEEIDLANPKNNTKNAGFTKEEREGFTDFLADGYVDTYRKLYPDQKAAYTFWSYMSNARAKNIGWRLDYFIVSDRIMERVCDNQIRHQVYGSDHCPLTVFLHV